MNAFCGMAAHASSMVWLTLSLYVWSVFGLHGGFSMHVRCMLLFSQDFGSQCTRRSDGSCDMGLSTINAAKALNSYYGVPFTSIEITPMIGTNDDVAEIFTLADVDTVSQFAKANRLAGVHHWSFDRDTDCPRGAASATCNSVGNAGMLGYTKRFLTALGM